MSLVAGDHDRLIVLEQQIEAGRFAVGTALAEIQADRLYLVEHASFEQYCLERWGFSRSRAYQMIEAAAVVSNMLDSGAPLPANDRQACALAAAPPEERADVMVKVTTNGSRPTAAAITAEVQARHPKPKPAPAPPPSPRSPVAEAEPDTTCRGLCGTTADDPSMVGGWCQTCLEEQNPSPRDLRPTALRKQAEAGDIDAMWKRVGALKKALREFPTVAEVMATLPHADSIESLDAVAEKAERLAMTWKQDRKANSGLRLVEEAR